MSSYSAAPQYLVAQVQLDVTRCVAKPVRPNESVRSLGSSIWDLQGPRKSNQREIVTLPIVAVVRTDVNLDPSLHPTQLISADLHRLVS